MVRAAVGGLRDAGRVGAMKVLVHVVFWVAMVGSVTSSIYCGMVLAAAARFGLRKRREQSAVPDFLPAVSMLKPLHGTEPGMELNIASFFEQEYPGEWELLFCARQESDEGLRLARSVGARYSQVDARYVTCGEPTP
jgi:ceramide glucosyltransferase